MGSGVVVTFRADDRDCILRPYCAERMPTWRRLIKASTACWWLLPLSYDAPHWNCPFAPLSVRCRYCSLLIFHPFTFNNLTPYNPLNRH